MDLPTQTHLKPLRDMLLYRQHELRAEIQATEKASLCRGLVAGLKAGPPQKELPEPSLAP